MPKIIKPGMDPATIKRRTRAAQRSRQRTDDAQDLKHPVDHDPYDLPDNVRPMSGPTNISLARRGIVDTANDPTLLEQVMWIMSKAVMGFTYQQIAILSEDELGTKISRQRVGSLVTREMARRKDPLVKEIRRMEDARLNYLLTMLEEKVKDHDVQAIHEARLISESRRRMFGADMPTNVRVTGEVEHKLDPAVTKMIEESKERIRKQQEDQAQAELDDPAIIDAEVVEEPDYRDNPYQEEDEPADDEEIEVEDV